MPITAGPVPGATSGLRMVRLDPGHFRTGRWLLLAEGVAVSAFGVAGLVSAVLHPHAGRAGAPVLGMASTPAHSVVLVALGVAAIVAVGKRRAAVAITAASALAYMALLFFSAVATTRTKPTLFGFHAADVLLHGILAVVNLALLMWLIPDELGDPTWVPRRRRGREAKAADAVSEPTATSLNVPATSTPLPPSEPAEAPTREPDAGRSPPRHRFEPGHSGAGVADDEPAAATHDAANSKRSIFPLPRGAALVAVAVLAAVIVVSWVRRRRSHR
ncbi:DUF4383 domain-containing protein [Mycobacterium sp. Marseille-P9652]|uniref:DUF4383 domain-containing protein n=1 Tax=Mycobacterium sp. Marseille-P9652 TaxID=2654950 RepID=UPI0012E81A50|nr:DUF4383 domain-containing protein [Mycobacterium sp. Marseille-P9652]